MLRLLRLPGWPAQHCHRHLPIMSQATQWIVDVYADLPERRQQGLQDLQQAWTLETVISSTYQHLLRVAGAVAAWDHSAD